jgi:glycosyltransferase involved in cell wall biosynthesis
LRIITFLLPKRNPHPIGGFKIVYEYANRFAQDNFQINIILPASLLWKQRNLADKLKNIGSYIIFSILQSYYLPYSWFNLDRKIKILWVPSLEEKYIPDSDHIFATSCETAEYLKEYSPNKGEKYYLIQHKEDWFFSERRLLKTYKYKFNKIVISKWLQDLLVDNDEESTLIYNGLDFDRFKIKIPIAEKDKNKILMLYHPAFWKGSELGIKIIQKLRKINPDIELTMFGATPRPKSLPSQISYFQSPNQEKLVDLYNRSGIFLGTSYSEGWGLTVAEAMQCGCAVVCTNAHGYNEMVIHKSTGLLSELGDVESLTKNILTLHSNHDLRIKLAENGNKFIQKFRWDQSYNKIKNLLETTSKFDIHDCKNFPQVSLIFNYINSNPSFFWIGDNLLLGSSEKKSYWNGNILDVFINDLVRTIYNLPKGFALESKKQFIKNHSKKSKLFSIRNLVKMRFYNELNYTIILKNKNSLKDFTHIPFMIYFLISIFPRSIISLYIKSIHRIWD